MISKYVKPLKRDIIINMIIKIVGTLVEVVLPVILAHIIDKVVPLNDTNKVIFWGVVMVLLSILAWFMNVYANRMASKTSSTAIKNIRQDLFERSMRLSARQIDKLGISSLESRLTSDTYVIHRFLGATLRMGLRSLMMFLGGVFFSVYLSPRLSIVLIALIIPLFLVVRYIFSIAIPLFRKVQIKLDDMVQIIRENIRGIKVTKALDKVEYEKGRYNESNTNLSNLEIETVDKMAMMGPLVNTILYGGLTVVLIWGANLVDQGALQVGIIVAYLSYFIQITNSLMMMNRMFNMYNRSKTSTQRIEEVINMPTDANQIIVKKNSLPPSNENIPEIEFKNVSFSYLGEKNDLEDINFKVYPGQSLGIMGATGSGKSTIIRLLLRQYDVLEGEILIRGVNIKTLDEQAINNIFGTVFQNDFLFRGTIRENIDFGRNYSDDILLKAAKHAQAFEFIDRKDGGLDFKLESKGVNLSGGQKQRILLSRALAGNPDILILDDSSSALDFRTDANLRQELDKYFKNNTQIIIAQRISSVIKSEQILFLDHGRQIALGSHEKLLETCELYREIAQTQMGDTEILERG